MKSENLRFTTHPRAKEVERDLIRKKDKAKGCSREQARTLVLRDNPEPFLRLTMMEFDVIATNARERAEGVVNEYMSRYDEIRLNNPDLQGIEVMKMVDESNLDLAKRYRIARDNLRRLHS